MSHGCCPTPSLSVEGMGKPSIRKVKDGFRLGGRNDVGGSIFFANGEW